MTEQQDLSTKTIDNPNPFEKECQEIYNQAVEHCIEIVEIYKIDMNDVVFEEIINSLNKLKKQ